MQQQQHKRKTQKKSYPTTLPDVILSGPELRMHINRLKFYMKKHEFELPSVLDDVHDHLLPDALASLEKPFFQQLNVLAALRSSSFDTQQLLSVTKLEPTDKFQTAYQHLIQQLMRMVPPTSSPNFDTMSQLLWLLLKTLAAEKNIKKQFDYWCKETFHPHFVQILKVYIVHELANATNRSSLEYLALCRPTLIRDLYGVSPETKTLEELSYLIQYTFRVPMIRSIMIYENFCREMFETRKFTQDEVGQKLKDECIRILDLDATVLQSKEKFAEHFPPLAKTILSDRGRSLVRKTQELWKSDPSMISYALYLQLKPLHDLYRPGGTLSDFTSILKEKATEIIPKILKYLLANQHPETQEFITAVTKLAKIGSDES